MRRKELGWEVGGAPFASNRWFCNVSRLPSPQRCAMVTGCWRRPQPPSPLLVLSALRYSRRVVATGAGGAGGSVARTGIRAPRCLARVARPGAAARLGPAAVGQLREQTRAGRLRWPPRRHLPRLVVNSQLQLQAESRGAPAAVGRPDSWRRTAEPAGRCSWPHLLANGLARTGRGGRGQAEAARHYHAQRSQLQAPTLLTS